MMKNILIGIIGICILCLSCSKDPEEYIDTNGLPNAQYKIEGAAEVAPGKQKEEYVSMKRDSWIKYKWTVESGITFSKDYKGDIADNGSLVQLNFPTKKGVYKIECKLINYDNAGNDYILTKTVTVK